MKRYATQADYATAHAKVSMLGNGQQIRLDANGVDASWYLFRDYNGKTYIGYKVEDADRINKFFKNRPELEFYSEVEKRVTFIVQAL